MNALWRTSRGDRGASAVEYAVLVALVAAVVGVGILAFGQLVPALYQVAFPTGA
ncbi:hypothetical protein [Aeromicrobium sp. Sec7.5]|uniref:hypothetical protein n=1 Tax=Aeromicrobium sp. Sec7.5 TaxID=3121276 RepID=UPI002FE4D518